MSLSQRLLSAFFALAGTMHFVVPRSYAAIVPLQIPAKEAVAVSGVAEIVGGLAVASPRTRGFARWWLLGLLAAVFPANVYMTLRPHEVAARGVPADRIPPALLWLRLPLQPLMMWWVWRATAQSPRSSA